jgi:hypothetical protein
MPCPALVGWRTLTIDGQRRWLLWIIIWSPLKMTSPSEKKTETSYRVVYRSRGKWNCKMNKITITHTERYSNVASKFYEARLNRPDVFDRTVNFLERRPTGNACQAEVKQRSSKTRIQRRTQRTFYRHIIRWAHDKQVQTDKCRSSKNNRIILSFVTRMWRLSTFTTAYNNTYPRQHIVLSCASGVFNRLRVLRVW